MVDYTKPSGTGFIMIRDTGSTVEFWVKANDSYTWGNGFTFSGTRSGSFNYPSGGNYLRVASFAWTGNGNVTFTLNGTGTQGLGGPTTLTVYISRATVPSPPTMLGIDQLTQTSMRVRFSSNGDGGSPVREWQVGYSSNGASASNSVSSGGTSVITNLTPATTWYAWARGRNDVGWSGWSARASGRTVAGAYIRVDGTWKEAVPYVRVGGVWKLAQPYVRDGGVWKIVD